MRKGSTTGQALFLQGDLTAKGGRVKLSKVLEDGNELTLDIRKAGDFIGENMFYSLIDQSITDRRIAGSK